MPKTIISIENAAVLFAQQTALRNINLEINKGDFIVVAGPNGSGKSTLLRVIAQLQPLHQGKIIFHGAKQAPRIATISQHSQHNLAMSLSIYDNAKLYQLSKNNKDNNKENNKNNITNSKHKKNKLSKQNLQSLLETFNANLNNFLDKPVKQLSGGEQQALALALVINQQPDILLLDEHTAALDPIASENIMRITQQQIKKHNISCLMISHNQQHLENIGNKTIAMYQGSIQQYKEHK